jgi:hypothetical protein
MATLSTSQCTFGLQKAKATTHIIHDSTKQQLFHPITLSKGLLLL